MALSKNKKLSLTELKRITSDMPEYVISEYSASDIFKLFNIRTPSRSSVFSSDKSAREYMESVYSAIELSMELDYNASKLKYSEGVRGYVLYKRWCIGLTNHPIQHRSSRTDHSEILDSLIDFNQVIDYAIRDRMVIDLSRGTSTLDGIMFEAKWYCIISQENFEKTKKKFKKRIMYYWYNEWCTFKNISSPSSQYSSEHITKHIPDELFESFMDNSVEWVDLCEKVYDIQMIEYTTKLMNRASLYKKKGISKEIIMKESTCCIITQK